MQLATGVTKIENIGALIEGTGASALVGNTVVLVKDGHIDYVGSSAGLPEIPADTHVQTLDARGGTVLPGLVEAHWHGSYFNVRELEDLDTRYPAEMVALIAADNARLALECGYTSVRSGGTLFNIDYWLAKAIDENIVIGPRLCPSGREICGAGGLMDWNPDFRKIGMEGLTLNINGPIEARAAVRLVVKDGAQWIKTYPTGDAAAPGTNNQHGLCMTYEECEAAASEAHNFGRKVTGHCRATQGIKNALLAGYDAIEHGTFMDSECLDLLLERDVPCVPALYFEKASVLDGPACGHSQIVTDQHKETLEVGTESARMIYEAGGRLGLGGDFGFAWCPHGDYANEIEFFAKDVGLPVIDVIKCATKTGAEIAGFDEQLGTLETGKLADILVVDGDVQDDIALLKQREKFIAVMQGGTVKAGQIAKAGQTAKAKPRHKLA